MIVVDDARVRSHDREAADDMVADLCEAEILLEEMFPFHFLIKRTSVVVHEAAIVSQV